ncbi:MAG: hypothetical protein DWP94_15050 [Flavobacterium sp.]|nr:MAG: hypothetical protein DWP94_15050 [Flavobacterium sp.]
MGSCSTDSSVVETEDNDPDPMEDPVLNEYTFVFNINFTIINGPGTFFISDAEGNILGQGPALSNQQTQIVVESPANTIFDLTSMNIDTNQNGEQSYSIYVHQGIEPGTYEMNNLAIDNPPSQSLKLSITNIGSSSLKRPSHGDFDFAVGYSPSNGGTIDFASHAIFREGFGGYYMSLIRDNETEERYYWSENPPLIDPEIIDYETLPIQTNFITMSTPPDFTLSTFLELQGYHPNNNSGLGNSMAVRTQFDGFPPLTYGLPDGIFNRYRLHNIHIRGNRGYQIIRTSSTPFTELPLSDLNMDLSSSSVNSFIAQIEGDGDVYIARFEYLDPQDNTEFILQIHGDPKPNISFSKTALVNNILNGIISPSNFELTYVDISDYENVETYSNYFRAYFDRSLSLPIVSENFTRFIKDL